MMWILHLIALFVFPLALFVTIPMHIIISNTKGLKNEKANHNLTTSGDVIR